jgi:hypothetical protein
MLAMIVEEMVEAITEKIEQSKRLQWGGTVVSCSASEVQTEMASVSYRHSLNGGDCTWREIPDRWYQIAYNIDFGGYEQFCPVHGKKED